MTTFVLLLLAGCACFAPSGSPLDAFFGLFPTCARAPSSLASDRSFSARPTKGLLVPPCCDYHWSDSIRHVAVDANAAVAVRVAAIGAGVFLEAAVFPSILGIGDRDHHVLRPASVVVAEALVALVVAMSSCYPPEKHERYSNLWDDPSSKMSLMSLWRKNRRWLRPETAPSFPMLPMPSPVPNGGPPEANTATMTYPWLVAGADYIDQP